MNSILEQIYNPSQPVIMDKQHKIFGLQQKETVDNLQSLNVTVVVDTCLCMVTHLKIIKITASDNNIHS